MKTKWKDGYLYGEHFTEDEFEYHYDNLYNKYFTDDMMQQNIKILERRGGSDSWKHIALWTCDVIGKREDYILPTVLKDLWETMVEKKMILKYIENGNIIYSIIKN